MQLFNEQIIRHNAPVEDHGEQQEHDQNTLHRKIRSRQRISSADGDEQRQEGAYDHAEYSIRIARPDEWILQQFLVSSPFEVPWDEMETAAECLTAAAEGYCDNMDERVNDDKRK